MTKEEFVKPFTLLCEMYDREASQLLMEGYYLVLEGLSKDEFEGAIKQVLSNRKYSSLPLPADILEAVHGNPEDKAILALKMVENAMQEHGAYKSVSFEDKIALTCIENLGGWVSICQMELKDWDWKKKEFISLYKAFMRNPQNVKKTTHLVGLIEHQNTFRGYDEYLADQQVVMIGYKETKQVPLLEMVNTEPKDRVLSLAQNLVKAM